MNKKIVDIIIIAGLILAVFVGIITAKQMHSTASKQIEATSKIEFDVFLRSVTLSSDECPIRVGEKTFISIRNVPYSDLDIIGVKFMPKKVVLPLKSPKGYIVAVDEGQYDTYDIVVRVTDKAHITKDGAVVGGNKIKMGMPITLEGKMYKFTGSVSDMKFLEETGE
ncbi:MAG: DUF4330 domain-containing protein [Candidatus Gastranaerophilales bacterium]|nr:DUF4330 domain-containing protein [Candidatus Gastranaerophilales bacterium]